MSEPVRKCPKCNGSGETWAEYCNYFMPWKVVCSACKGTGKGETMLWVREIKTEDGRWLPDMDEAMCMLGTRKEAEGLLSDYVGDKDYRVRCYRRVERKREEKRDDNTGGRQVKAYP